MEESQEFIKGVIKGTVQIRQLGVEGLRGSPGGGGGGGGGGALRYRGGPHPRYVFRGRRGLF